VATPPHRHTATPPQKDSKQKVKINEKYSQAEPTKSMFIFPVLFFEWDWKHSENILLFCGVNQS